MTERAPFIIGPNDHRVIGGVFLTGYGLYTDWEEHSQPYEELYAEIQRDLPRKDSRLQPKPVIKRASATISEAFVSERVGTVLKLVALGRGKTDIKPEDQINLSNFITASTGVCYHRTLALPTIIELMQQRRNLEGWLSLRGFGTANSAAAHTTMLFTDSKGRTTEADPYYNVVGVD